MNRPNLLQPVCPLASLLALIAVLAHAGSQFEGSQHRATTPDVSITARHDQDGSATSGDRHGGDRAEMASWHGEVTDGSHAVVPVNYANQLRPESCGDPRDATWLVGSADDQDVAAHESTAAYESPVANCDDGGNAQRLPVCHGAP